MSISPPILLKGDTIAVLAPASAVDHTLVEGACARLRREGYNVREYPSCTGRYASYSASASQRSEELCHALGDMEVRAILCARGGYGCVHLLDSIRVVDPKWVIGFSDVSALHALFYRNGIASVHASMAKELALSRCPGDEANKRLFHLLSTGKNAPLAWDANALSVDGEACGTLVGGNLAVIAGLISTPYNVIGEEGSILLIEDVAEPVYKVERVMWQLRLSGALGRLSGIVCGQFTQYNIGPTGETMEQMLHRMLSPLRVPLAMNAPIGHIDGNLPVVLGRESRLKVSEGKAWLENY